MKKYTGTKLEAYERVLAHLDHAIALIQLVKDIVRKYRL